MHDKDNLHRRIKLLLNHLVLHQMLQVKQQLLVSHLFTVLVVFSVYERLLKKTVKTSF